MYCTTSEFFQYTRICYCLPFKEAWEWKKSLGLPRWHKVPSWNTSANGATSTSPGERTPRVTQGSQSRAHQQGPTYHFLYSVFSLTDAFVSISSQWTHCSPWMGYPLEAAFSLPADIHGTTSLCFHRGCWVCKKQKIVLANYDNV